MRRKRQVKEKKFFFVHLWYLQEVGLFWLQMRALLYMGGGW
jgi:hypothetical protein